MRRARINYFKILRRIRHEKIAVLPLVTQLPLFTPGRKGKPGYFSK